MIPVQAAKDNDISVKVEGINEQSVPAMNQEEKGVECNESQKIYIFKCLFFYRWEQSRCREPKPSGNRST